MPSVVPNKKRQLCCPFLTSSFFHWPNLLNFILIWLISLKLCYLPCSSYTSQFVAASTVVITVNVFIWHLHKMMTSFGGSINPSHNINGASAAQNLCLCTHSLTHTAGQPNMMTHKMCGTQKVKWGPNVLLFFSRLFLFDLVIFTTKTFLFSFDIHNVWH